MESEYDNDILPKDIINKIKEIPIPIIDIDDKVTWKHNKW